MHIDQPWHLDGLTCSLEPDPLPPEKVVVGAPTTSVRELFRLEGELALGVWEHSEGTSVDVEVDEVFVVLAGRATVTYADGQAFDLRPGSIVGTPAGTSSTWTVHEPLRKVYLVKA